MVVKRCTWLLVVLLIVIVVFLPIVNAHVQVSQPTPDYTDLEISADESPYVIRDMVYVHHGNIRVYDGGVLVISYATLKIVHHGIKFQITVDGSSKVLFQNALLESDYMLDVIISGNSVFECRDSTINFNGTLRTDKTAGYVSIVNSNLNIHDLWLDSAESIQIHNSMVSTSNTIFVYAKYFNATDTTFTKAIVFTDTIVNLIGVKLPSVSGVTAEITIYKWVCTNVFDSINIPVGNAKVICFYHSTGIQYAAPFTTDKNGFVKFALPSDRITNGIIDYIGNYYAYAYFDTEDRRLHSGIVNFSLPHYRQYTQAEIALIETSIDIVLKFNEPIFESTYYSESPQDIIIEENYSIEDTAGMQITDDEKVYTYIHRGNIIVQGDGVLTVKDYARLKIEQSDARYSIIVKNNGSLILQNNAYLCSNLPLNIYLLDNAKLEIKNSNIQINALVLFENTNISFSDAKINATITGVAAGISIENTVINGDKFDITTDYLWISGSKITVASLSIKSPKYTIADTELNQPLSINGDTEVILIAVDTPIKVFENAIVYRYWHVNVNVINGHARPVPNADVYVYQMKNSSAGIPELTDTKLVTDDEGKLELSILSEIITSNQRLFVGNIWLIAGYRHNEMYNKTDAVYLAVNSNKFVTLQFTEILIPPFYLTTTLFITPTVAVINETIVIEGVVYYNKGPDVVPNATVTITIIDTRQVIKVTTDEKGRYKTVISAPYVLKERAFAINISVFDPKYELVCTAEQHVTVKPPEPVPVELFPIELQIGLAAIIIGAVAIWVASYISARKELKRRMEAPVRREPIIEWALEELRR